MPSLRSCSGVDTRLCFSIHKTSACGVWASPNSNTQHRLRMTYGAGPWAVRGVVGLVSGELGGAWLRGVCAVARGASRSARRFRGGFAREDFFYKKQKSP